MPAKVKAYLCHIHSRNGIRFRCAALQSVQSSWHDISAPFTRSRIKHVRKPNPAEYILVRGTPTAGVLLHWVIISRRWERNQKRDSE